MLALEITSFEILEELATSLVDADELCDHTDRGACIEISPSSHRDAKALNARISRSLQSTCSVVKFGVVDAVSDVLNGDAVVSKKLVENARAGNVLNELDLGITGVGEIEMAHPIARLATVRALDIDCPQVLEMKELLDPNRLRERELANIGLQQIQRDRGRGSGRPVVERKELQRLSYGFPTRLL